MSLGAKNSGGCVLDLESQYMKRLRMLTKDQSSSWRHGPQTSPMPGTEEVAEVMVERVSEDHEVSAFSAVHLSSLSQSWS